MLSVLESRVMSHRKSQIESTLQRAISQMLSRRLSDPRIVGMVSVTRVEVTPDRHEAHVFVSVMPEKYQNKTVAGLRHATKHIHSLLCKAVQMRAVPHLVFQLDPSLKKQAAVFDAISRASNAPPNDLSSENPSS